MMQTTTPTGLRALTRDYREADIRRAAARRAAATATAAGSSAPRLFRAAARTAAPLARLLAFLPPGH